MTSQVWYADLADYLGPTCSQGLLLLHCVRGLLDYLVWYCAMHHVCGCLLRVNENAAAEMCTRMNHNMLLTRSQQA
jgi:hypothetical protein